MRWLSISVFLLFGFGCQRQPKLAQGPQPYLIVRVTTPKGGEIVGTVAENIRFDYSQQSRDGSNSVEMHALLIQKLPSGFSLLWQSIYRADGHDTAILSQDQFAPWGRETRFPSRDGYIVSVFYASKPANELFHR